MLLRNPDILLKHKLESNQEYDLFQRYVKKTTSTQMPLNIKEDVNNCVVTQRYVLEASLQTKPDPGPKHRFYYLHITHFEV